VGLILTSLFAYSPSGIWHLYLGETVKKKRKQHKVDWKDTTQAYLANCREGRRKAKGWNANAAIRKGKLIEGVIVVNPLPERTLGYAPRQDDIADKGIPDFRGTSHPQLPCSAYEKDA
jgi:hypothetical protein